MGVVSNLTKRVDVPGEPGQWIEIRMLSYLTLDKSRKLRLRDLSEQAGPGIAAMVGAMDPQAREAAKAAAAADPLSSHDVGTILRHGIVAWSYGDPAVPENADDSMAPWAAREILGYSLPDDAQKKRSASSSSDT